VKPRSGLCDIAVHCAREVEMLWSEVVMFMDDPNDKYINLLLEKAGWLL
jgi:hypothetical protein